MKKRLFRLGLSLLCIGLGLTAVSCAVPTTLGGAGVTARNLLPNLFPYAPTNYDEPYRGQFHFSSQGGWMNDVNGLWYSGGKYYMTYQHYPYSLAWNTMHWGLATSPDMIHWTQQPIALVPGVNAPGDCFSGSVVVDTTNTSGLKTGANPVFVAIYTATNSGTSLAYSNDLGVTWQGYSGNPVNVAGPNADTRDPHVFWYAPTNKWVCVIFENGTSFYTSSNLKTWTKTSTFNFGFECPDMFQLAVDGGSTLKWVVMDAGLNYSIGSFNGLAFTPELGPFKMDANGHNGNGGLYASQTFFRNNFPTNRVVQLGWQTTNNGSVWTNNASFPSEIKLVTFPEGVRATRLPIAEISSLFTNARSWGAQTVTSGSNLLNGIFSKNFEIDAVFNVNGATAGIINFNLPGVTVAYDVVHHTLMGQPLNPLNGLVTIKILVDWGQLEVYGNNGELSYTANNNFSLTDSSMGLSTNGNVSLVSMQYNTVSRTWPGTAGSGSTSAGVTVDDTSPYTVYGGAWTSVANDAAYLNRTCQVSNAAGAFVQMGFTGTSVAWFGLKNTDLGMADVYIDNALVQTVDCYAQLRTIDLLYAASGLSNGAHTIKAVVKGTKNSASSGTALVHDYFSLPNGTPTGVASTVASVNDAAAATTYTGAWNYVTNDATYLNSDCHVSNVTNAAVQYTFTGNSVAWYGLKNNDLGLASVSIDGVLAQANIDCYSTTRAVNRLFSTEGLTPGSHTIQVVVTGAKNAASAGTYLVHDSFAAGTLPVNGTSINDANVANGYSGAWSYATNDAAYLNGDCHVSNTANGWVQYTFNGTGFDWYGLKNGDLGRATVVVDGAVIQTGIDCYSTTRGVSKLFTMAGLTPGSHTVRVVVEGTKNAASAGTYLVHDSFRIYQ